MMVSFCELCLLVFWKQRWPLQIPFQLQNSLIQQNREKYSPSGKTSNVEIDPGILNIWFYFSTQSSFPDLDPSLLQYLKYSGTLQDTDGVSADAVGWLSACLFSGLIYGQNEAEMWLSGSIYRVIDPSSLEKDSMTLSHWAWFVVLSVSSETPC